MDILSTLQESIGRIGVKEIARRTGLSASTISRVNSDLIRPSFDVVEKIAQAVGYHLEIRPETKIVKPPRLEYAKNILMLLRKELKSLDVKHAVIFGSVARGEDRVDSDIDIYLEFSEKPNIAQQLRAEGRVIEIFGDIKVDVVSRLDSPNGRRLMAQIEKDGVRVF